MLQKNELVDRLKSVITDSADEILSKTLSKLSESPGLGPDKGNPRGGEGMYASLTYVSGSFVYILWIYSLCLGGEGSSPGTSHGLQALARGSAIVKSKLKLSGKTAGPSRKEMVRHGTTIYVRTDTRGNTYLLH